MRVRPVLPGFVAFVDPDAVIDEPERDGVFDLVDAIVVVLRYLTNERNSR